MSRKLQNASTGPFRRFATAGAAALMLGAVGVAPAIAESAMDPSPRHSYDEKADFEAWLDERGENLNQAWEDVKENGGELSDDAAKEWDELTNRLDEVRENAADSTKEGWETTKREATELVNKMEQMVDERRNNKM